MTALEGVQAYIRRTRNPVKKVYAQQLYWFKLLGGSQPEPKTPDSLSYMGAQAVRLEVDGIFQTTR